MWVTNVPNCVPSSPRKRPERNDHQGVSTIPGPSDGAQIPPPSAAPELEIDGLSIRYVAGGSPTGQPLVLLSPLARERLRLRPDLTSPRLPVLAHRDRSAGLRTIRRTSGPVQPARTSRLSSADRRSSRRRIGALGLLRVAARAPVAQRPPEAQHRRAHALSQRLQILRVIRIRHLAPLRIASRRRRRRRHHARPAFQRQAAHAREH
jgi:hypothetical protein